MRFADESDLSKDAMSAEQSDKYRSLARKLDTLRNHKSRIHDLVLWSLTLSPLAAAPLEVAEAKVEEAIDEVHREIERVLKGDGLAKRGQSAGTAE